MLRGSNPSNSAIVVGITLIKRVTRRLNQMLTFIPSNPSITAWPAKVPTTEEEMPDESNVITKAIPAPAPNSGIKVL